LPIEKSLVKKIYKFCQKKFFKPRIDVGFANKKISQKKIKVLPIEKNLAKKDTSFANRKKFSQKKKFCQ
jgi:hypothetical protein